jgi:hypothetical protein
MVDEQLICSEIPRSMPWMWREGHFCNSNVLQIMPLSNLVSLAFMHRILRIQNTAAVTLTNTSVIPEEY